MGDNQSINTNSKYNKKVYIYSVDVIILKVKYINKLTLHRYETNTPAMQVRIEMEVEF